MDYVRTMLEINKLSNSKLFYKETQSKTRNAITYKRVSKRSNFYRFFRKQREISSIKNELTLSTSTFCSAAFASVGSGAAKGRTAGTINNALRPTLRSQNHNQVVPEPFASYLRLLRKPRRIRKPSLASCGSLPSCFTVEAKGQQPKVGKQPFALVPSLAKQPKEEPQEANKGSVKQEAVTVGVVASIPNALLPRVEKEQMGPKQYQQLVRIAYYQAGKTVVQTLLPQHPPVSLIKLNPIGLTVSTSADVYIPSDPISNIQCCSSLESRLIGFYGGKATSQLFEYEYESINSINFVDKSSRSRGLLPAACVEEKWGRSKPYIPLQVVGYRSKPKSHTIRSTNHTSEFSTLQALPLQVVATTNKLQSGVVYNNAEKEASQLKKSLSTSGHQKQYNLKSIKKEVTFISTHKACFPASLLPYPRRIRKPRLASLLSEGSKPWLANTPQVGQQASVLKPKPLPLLAKQPFASCFTLPTVEEKANFGLRIRRVPRDKQVGAYKAAFCFASEGRTEGRTAAFIQESQELLARLKIKNKRKVSNFSTKIIRVLSSHKIKSINSVNKSKKFINSINFYQLTSCSATFGTEGRTAGSMKQVAVDKWRAILPLLPALPPFSVQQSKGLLLPTEASCFATFTSPGLLPSVTKVAKQRVEAAEENNGDASLFRKSKKASQSQQAKVAHCSFIKSNVKSRRSFAGVGNNFFQSNIGTSEIQTATRLANIMVNNWNFYSCNSTFVGEIDDTPYVQYATLLPKPTFGREVRFAGENQSKNTNKFLSKPWPASFGTIEALGSGTKVVKQVDFAAKNSKISTSTLETAGTISPLASQAFCFATLAPLPEASCFTAEAAVRRGSGNAHFFPALQALAYEYAAGKTQSKRLAKQEIAGGLPSWVLKYQKGRRIDKNGQLHLKKKKNVFLTHLFKPFCENSLIIKGSSYSSTRISVENVGAKQFLNVGIFPIFHLVNSFQFSNVQRDRFHLGWFRLYLPDIEATTFLKNVGNYFFNLGLQTFIRPSISNLNPSAMLLLPKPQGLRSKEPFASLPLLPAVLPSAASQAKVAKQKVTASTEAERAFPSVEAGSKASEADALAAVLPSAASLPTDAKVVWNKKQKGEEEASLELQSSRIEDSLDRQMLQNSINFVNNSISFYQRYDVTSTNLIKLKNVFLCLSEKNLTNNLRIGLGSLRNKAKFRNQIYHGHYSFLLIKNKKTKEVFNKHKNRVHHRIINKFDQITVKQEQLSFLDVSSFLLLEKQIFPMGAIMETGNSNTASLSFEASKPWLACCPTFGLRSREASLLFLPKVTNRRKQEKAASCGSQGTTVQQEAKGLASLLRKPRVGQQGTKEEPKVRQQAGCGALGSGVACGNYGNQKTSGIASSNINNVEKELVSGALINNCFTEAFLLINQNRQLLDYFVDYLIRFQILRQHQILYLFSAILLNCKK